MLAGGWIEQTKKKKTNTKNYARDFDDYNWTMREWISRIA